MIAQGALGPGEPWGLFLLADIAEQGQKFTRTRTQGRGLSSAPDYRTQLEDASYTMGLLSWKMAQPLYTIWFKEGTGLTTQAGPCATGGRRVRDQAQG